MHLRRTLFVLLAGVGFCTPLAQAQVRYTITDLGSLGQSMISFATEVNRFGQVAANADLQHDYQRAFLWSKGKKKVLGTLGGHSSVGFGLNRFQQVAGQSSLAGDQAEHAFFWDNGTFSDLGTFGGVNSFAFGLNDSGQVSGYAETPDTDPNTGWPVTHAFLWESGTLSDLGALGGNNSQAWAIDQSGRVTGNADTTTMPDPTYGVAPFHAFVYQNGTMSDLGSLLGGQFSAGYAIGGGGAVAGVADLPGDTEGHSFLWVNGKTQDLGVLPGETISYIIAINNKRQMVGISGFADPSAPPAEGLADCPCSAVIVQNGKMTDLNLLIPRRSGWDLYLATSINDAGQIVGQGQYQGHFRAYLLTPVKGSNSDGARTASIAGRKASHSGWGLKVRHSATGIEILQ